MESLPAERAAPWTPEPVRGDEGKNPRQWLANRWGVGREGTNDGIVLLVATRERELRITVGDGLERTLTNTICADTAAGWLA